MRSDGGTLVDRIVPAVRVRSLLARAAELPRVVLDAREVADLELIATGAASPLRSPFTSATNTGMNPSESVMLTRSSGTSPRLNTW